MIEEHISTEMNGVFKAVSEAGGDMQKVAPSGFPVLNMLNTRYFIFRCKVERLSRYRILIRWAMLGL